MTSTCFDLGAFCALCHGASFFSRLRAGLRSTDRDGTNLRVFQAHPWLVVAWFGAVVSCMPASTPTSSPADASASQTAAAPGAVLGPRTPQIAGGAGHTCVVLPDGDVACWGSNDNGQLGDGSGRPSRTPVQVTGVHGVVALASGNEHTCALQRAGTVMCWGDDTSGQLGDGRIASSDNRFARTLPELTQVVSIAAHGDQTCALQSSGLWCWGREENAIETEHSPRFRRLLARDTQELCVGDGFICDRHGGQISCWNSEEKVGTPSVVPGLVDADALACGAAGACAVRRDGTVACWGIESGDAWWSMRSVPGVTDAIDVSVSNHACAHHSSGAVTCWGGSRSGQAGTYASGPIVQAVRLPSAMDAVGVGVDHSCGRLRDGRFACWGSNSHGQSGWGKETISLTPERINNLADIDNVLAAGSFTCAMRRGEARCWGHVDGLAPTPDLTEPTPVDAFRQARGILMTRDKKICAWAEDGGARCILGSPNIPTRDVLQIAQNEWHQPWVLRSDGGWRAPYAEPRVTPEDFADAESLRRKPQPILELSEWSENGVCARLKDGAMRCILDLDDATNAESAFVVGRATRTLTDVRALRTSAHRTCALLGDGTVACMFSTYSEGPPEMSIILGLRDVVEIAAGYTHYCARTRDGSVLCWGSNYHGQLGNGTTFASIDVPVKVSGLTGARALALGSRHSCALTQQREVYCWGDHQGNGYFAHSTASSRSASPVFVGSGGSSPIAPTGETGKPASTTPWTPTTPDGAKPAHAVNGLSSDLPPRAAWKREADMALIARRALPKLRACKDTPRTIIADLDIVRGRAVVTALNLHALAPDNPPYHWHACVQPALERVRFPPNDPAGHTQVRLTLR